MRLEEVRGALKLHELDQREKAADTAAHPAFTQLQEFVFFMQSSPGPDALYRFAPRRGQKRARTRLLAVPPRAVPVHTFNLNHGLGY